jgi:hypothetical protein
MAEEKFDMECTYEEGKTEDLVTFTRSGVNGELRVNKDLFLLDAQTGLSAGRIQGKNRRRDREEPGHIAGQKTGREKSRSQEKGLPRLHPGAPAQSCPSQTTRHGRPQLQPCAL